MSFALYGYDKYDGFSEFLIGEPKLPFDIADNINELPNSAKCVVLNTTENAYDPNTIVKETESAMWFIIKQDDCEFISYDEDDVAIYKHTLQLGDMLEYFSFVRVPSCVFPAGRYTLAKAFTRLFNIAKVSITITWANYTFVDSTTRTKHFSFNKNYQLSTAIRDLCKSFNAIAYLWYDSGFHLGFKQRYGYGVPLGAIDTIFPSVQRKISSNSDKYMTRVYSPLENVRNSNYIMYPNNFGVHSVDTTSLAFDGDKALIPLPNKISDVFWLQMLRPCKIVRQLRDISGTIIGSEALGIYETYNNLTAEQWKAFAIRELNLFSYITESDINASADFPHDWEIGLYDGSGWNYLFNLLPPRDYETTEPSNATNTDQEHSFTWETDSTYIKVPKALTYTSAYTTIYDYEIMSKAATGTDTEHLIIRLYTAYHYKTFFRVMYSPIGDVVLSYDNDDEAQDERPYNQSGTLLDGYSVSKLVSAYADESASETITRYKEFSTFASIYSCGQKVIKDNRQYVIGQRSIDCYKDKFLVLFSLTRDKVARDENVSADTDVSTYAVPDKNLVKRVQIYKDYLEIGIYNGDGHHDSPYLVPTLDLLTFNSANNVGFIYDFDGICATYNSAGTTIERFVVPTTRMPFVRSIIFRTDFMENYIIGIKQSGTNIQVPIRYADANGEVYRIRWSLIKTDDYASIMTASDYENLPQLSSATYSSLANNFSVAKDETTYDKSSYEIPVFQYHIEINGGTNALAQIVVGENILEQFPMVFSAPLNFAHYYYIISEIPITIENAGERYKILATDLGYNEYEHLAVISVGTTSDYIISLINTYPSTPNSVSLIGKHIGIYACHSATSMSSPKFLFAMNYYAHTSNTTIPINVNNWKI